MLIADDDLFAAAYVATVLIARGIQVVGPFACFAAALDVITVTPVQAAVIAGHDGCAKRGKLVASLERTNIPCLTILRSARREPITSTPILTSPFAAYQVADWVVEALDLRPA